VPFTIPGVRHPYSGAAAFGNVYMSHAGRAWEGTKSTYFPDGPHTPSRFHNHLTGALCDVPPVPAAFIEAARSATAEALRRAPGAFDPLPLDDGPDSLCCVINYYTQFCNISKHSDSSEPSLKEGKTWPVVSISVGDAADFTLFPNDDPASAVVITLRSGDVLLFGGASRLIRHEVKDIRSGYPARPPGLCMVPGRLNITIRGL
jgi:alkylated DNA repair protein (DNA oxidative demethylase)